MSKVYEVIAHLPATVELSRRATKDTLTVDISGGKKPGKLVIARGTIEWWPEGNKVNVRRAAWDDFAAICEEHLRPRRSGKKSRRPKK
jgi:hypothetical protein